MEEIVRIKNVSMQFNMSSEIIHSFKEYIIKLLKRQLFFKERLVFFKERRNIRNSWF